MSVELKIKPKQLKPSLIETKSENFEFNQFNFQLCFKNRFPIKKNICTPL